MQHTPYDASQAWKQALLSEEEYSHHCKSKQELQQIKKLGRVWSKIINLTGIKPSSRLFELGCGGGIHIGKLALNGFEVHGIDVSNNVVERSQNYLDEINKFESIKATVETSNIFSYSTHEEYDMAYHFGVVEHFLESDERRIIWEKLSSLTKPGGWIVSVVPNGQHIMRKMVRERELGGYNIPEIDYSCELHKKEFEALDLQPIYTIPHNYFDFLSVHPNKFVSKLVYPISFIIGNLLIPFLPLKPSIKENWTGTLIVVGQKPIK